MLDEEFRPQLRRIPTVAGLHLAARCEGVDHDTVAEWVEACARRGVAVASVADFALGETEPALVIGFGAIPLDQVDEGLRTLRAVVGS